MLLDCKKLVTLSAAPIKFKHFNLNFNFNFSLRYFASFQSTPSLTGYILLFNFEHTKILPVSVHSFTIRRIYCFLCGFEISKAIFFIINFSLFLRFYNYTCATYPQGTCRVKDFYYQHIQAPSLCYLKICPVTISLIGSLFFINCQHIFTPYILLYILQFTLEFMSSTFVIFGQFTNTKCHCFQLNVFAEHLTVPSFTQ